MKIEYDNRKATSNLKKHGVSFEEAASCLLDSMALVREDNHAENESRWLLLGMSNQARLLVVIYTLRGESIRLISARKPTTKEVMCMDKEYDFTNAKRAHDVPHLAKLQAEQGGGKARITMRVDNDTLAIFKARAEMNGGNYQTLMNEALRQFAQGLTLADVVRETIKQELHRV